ncbi:MAG: MFS transporter [Myxococcota bacterium]
MSPDGSSVISSAVSRRTRAALLLVGSLPVLAGAIIAPALPAIREQFAAIDDVDLRVRMLISLPSVVIALTAPLSGFLADTLGRRPLLYGALFLFVIGGTTGLYVDELSLLLAGRLLLGAGMGGIMTASTALVADLFSGAERQRFLGFQSAFMSLSGVVFLLAGGAAAGVTWRGPFLAYLAPVLLFPLLVGALPAPQASTAAQQKGAVQPTPVLFLGALFLLAHLGMNLFYLLPVQLPFLLREGLSVEPFVAGLMVAGSTLSGAIAALSYGRLRSRLPSSALLASVFLIAGPGLMVVGLAPSLPVVFAGTFLAGLGFGLQMPVLTTWIAEVTPVDKRGRVLGGFAAAVFFGQFISPLVAAPVIERVGLRGSTGLFVCAGVFSLGMALVAWLLTTFLERRSAGL